jgi:hypothetical protein
MRVAEMHYTVAEVALMLRLHEKTVLVKMHGRQFGEAVVNLGSPERPDYRIPASGVNGYLESNRVFRDEPGVCARTVGELRRKVAKVEQAKAA